MICSELEPSEEYKLNAMNTAENMIIQFVSVLIQSEIELMAAWRP
jgi:hypothetical protein